MSAEPKCNNMPRQEQTWCSGAVPDGKPLNLILEVVAGELTALGMLISNTQLRAGLLEKVSKEDSSALENLQLSDMLSQHLSAVAAFMRALASTLPSHWTGNAVSAARTVSLSSLAGKLSCDDDSEGQSYVFESSDVELF